MPKKVTYYAIVDEFSSRARPGGVLRRIQDETGQEDESFNRDLQWEFSPLLYAYERGNGDNQLVEISAAEAERIVERIRRGR